MRAILFAAGNDSTMPALTEARPAVMLSLMDRPFLQHVLEALVDAGVHHFDFVLHHRPELVEAHFGDGKRWGCEIRYYLARDGASQYRMLQAMPPADGPVVIAHADRLPLLPEAALTTAASAL